MCCHYRMLLVLTGVVHCAVRAYAQAPALYQEEAAFLAALDSPTLIDFEGIASPGSPVFLGDPGLFESNGVTIINNSQMFVQNVDAQYGSGSFLSPQGGEAQGVQIMLPENTIAVGFSYAHADDVAASAVLNGGTGLNLPAPGPGVLGFFGAIRETGIERVTVLVDGGGIDLDNLWYLVDPNPSPSGTYTDEAAFLVELNSPTLIDFEGIADPGEDVFLGSPGDFTDGVVTISNNSQMFVRNIVDSIYETGAVLAPQGADPQVVNIEVPTSTVAVGFSYGYRIYGFASATVGVNGSEAYILPPDTDGELGFFGAIRNDVPIESVTITVDGGAIDIDNVYFLVDTSVRPVWYPNEVGFLAAVESPALIDFEGIVDPGESTDYGNPGAYVELGVRFANESNMFVQNNDYYGTLSYLSPQGETPQSVLIQLPQETTAVGFSYSSEVATATINGSEVLELPAQPLATLGFFGVVRDTPIESILLTTDGDYFDVDNVWFVGARPGSGGMNAPGGGELDSSFGTNGVLLLTEMLESDDADFFGLGVQPNGGIVIAGTEYNDGQDPVVQVARIDLTGALDTTFGDDGLRSVDVGFGSGFVWDMTVLSDGSILVSGSGNRGNADRTSFIFKLDADGNVDTSFGSGGIVTENLDVTDGSPVDGYERIVLRADGNILLGTAGLGVHQLNASGIRDDDFGVSGIAQPNNSDWSSFGLAEAADGKIIFGGGTAGFDGPQDFIVGKYLADGSALDSSFGNGGISTTSVGVDNDELLDLAIDSQGRIAAVGHIELIGFNPRKTAIVRLLQNGELDPSFGYGGVRILDGIALRDITVTRVVNRPDGGILLLGTANAPLPFPNQEVFLMSLHEDGTLDETFAGQGWFELDVAPDPESSFLWLLRDALSIHPSGKIILLNWECACVTMLEAPEWGDADADGLADGIDPDDDNDGVLDGDDAFPFDPTESVDTDNDGIGDNADTDDDGDGMPDDFEIVNLLNPLDATDAAADADGDGFSNLEEFRARSDPRDPVSIPRPDLSPIINLLLGDSDSDQQSGGVEGQ